MENIWTKVDKYGKIWTRITAQLLQTNNRKSARSVYFSGSGSGTITGSATSKSPEVDLEVLASRSGSESGSGSWISMPHFRISGSPTLLTAHL